MRVLVALLLVVALGGCSADDPGSEPTNQVPTETSATIEPAAGWIVFQGPEGLERVRPDGTDRQDVVARGFSPHHPDWSPDGRLAYVPEREGSVDIWVADADGANARELVECTASCSAVEDPAWSPDGTQLAFWTNDEGQGTSVIKVVDVASGDLVLNVAAPSAVTAPSGPRWSPDGQRLVVAVETYEPDGADFRLVGSRLGLIDLLATRPRIEMITRPGLVAAYPDWSPDGDELVFMSGNLDPFSHQGAPSNISVIRPDGSGLRQVTHQAADDPWVALPDWKASSAGTLVTLIHDASYYTLATVGEDGEIAEITDEAGEPIPGAHPRYTPHG